MVYVRIPVCVVVSQRLESLIFPKNQIIDEKKVLASVINNHTALCSRANVGILVQTRLKIFGLRRVNLEGQREYAMPNW